MSKPVDDSLERRPIPRLYAHYHRLLIDLLEDLSHNSRVLWLGKEQGHIRRPDGQPNSYHKALYVLEDMTPYQDRLGELEAVQREGQAAAGAKKPGLLLPTVAVGVQHIVLSQTTSWASHAHPKEVIVGKLEQHIERTKQNLRAFESYATRGTSRDDPGRERLEQEIEQLHMSLELLNQTAETPLRELARNQKHTARLLYPPDLSSTEEASTTVYIRDVGLIVAGPGLGNPRAIEMSTRRKRRRDRMEHRLKPLLSFGNYEVYSEQAWQQAKEQAVEGR